jgi:hypothetical protein
LTSKNLLIFLEETQAPLTDAPEPVRKLRRTVRLVIVHFHLRPGWIRRVIELAGPFLARANRHEITQIMLASGEAPDPASMKPFRQQLPDWPVKLFVEPVFGYLSELSGKAGQLILRLRKAFNRLFDSQEDFIRDKLAASPLYPLPWSTVT